MEQRKILFKAKRLDNGEWCVGDLIHKGNKTYIYSPHINDRGFLVENEQVDPSTVCQFTGIYDKDGKEIFENDLVKDVQTKEVFVVVWNPVYACYSFLDENRNRYAAKNFADYPSKDFLLVENKFDRKEGKV